MLIVPEKFNRNSINVTSLMPPEQSGAWLLERMRQRIGFDSYADQNLLDFGCGVRFSQAIINGGLPIGKYFGIDVFRPMIRFLQKNVHDRRFSYAVLDAYHPSYNPHGKLLSPATTLPVDDKDFDIICMFSVITHQYPRDSQSIFSIARRHVRPDGHLFFTCFLDETIDTFEDRSPHQDGGRCFYNAGFLNEIVTGCGWRQTSRYPGEGPIIGDSFLYLAA